MLKELDELFPASKWQPGSYDVETKSGQKISCDNVEELASVPSAIWPQVNKLRVSYGGKEGWTTRTSINFEKNTFSGHPVSIYLSGSFEDVLYARTRVTEFINRRAAWYSALSRRLWWVVLQWSFLGGNFLFDLLVRKGKLPQWNTLWVIGTLCWLFCFWMDFFGRKWLFPSAIYAFGSFKDEPQRVNKRLDRVGKAVGGVIGALITAELIKIIVNR